MSVANSFKVTSKRISDVTILYPQGYLNNIAGESLMKQCKSYIESDIRKVVLNFRETDFINTIGISMLLSIIEKLKEAGGTLCFTDLSKTYSDTFEMLGLTEFILVFPDENAAVKYLTNGNKA
ncbi:MAG: STAS domain-containing protein [Nitrospirae bacterium]|nr:STAS domain-containing protein [Nitrospirota bacterium]